MKARKVHTKIPEKMLRAKLGTKMLQRYSGSLKRTRVMLKIEITRWSMGMSMSLNLRRTRRYATKAISERIKQVVLMPSSSLVKEGLTVTNYPWQALTYSEDEAGQVRRYAAGIRDVHEKVVVLVVQIRDDGDRVATAGGWAAVVLQSRLSSTHSMRRVTNSPLTRYWFSERLVDRALIHNCRSRLNLAGPRFRSCKTKYNTKIWL